jgi:hypothetical protein
MCQVNELGFQLSPAAAAAGEQTFDAFDVVGDTNSHSHYAHATLFALYTQVVAGASLAPTP